MGGTRLTGLLCVVACVVAAAGGSAVASTPMLQTQSFTSQGCGDFTVPADVTSINAQATGAAGASNGDGLGGLGDTVSGSFSVVPGEMLYVCVDSGGGSGGQPGGGASSIAIVESGSDPFLVVAGGGGGGGSITTAAGGDAGYPAGGVGGGGAFAGGGGGGTQDSDGTPGTAGGGGGPAPGVAGQPSGSGVPGPGGSGGGAFAGGGGGGYYGGGGGGAGELDGGAGGGGSDYCDSVAVTGCPAVPAHDGTQAVAGSGGGDAQVVLSWYTSTVASDALFTTKGCSSWAVPAGVASIDVEAVGAAGAAGGGADPGAGGDGDGVASSLAVSAGEQLDICVDYGGGAAYGNGGDGGGASGVALGTTFASPLVIAGGGGGGGGNGGGAGGGAGESVGATGGSSGGTGGAGGSNISPVGPGAGGQDAPDDHGTGGNGTAGSATNADGPGTGGTGAVALADGGGGGAGFYGGGGGSAAELTGSGAGGGGGSDDCDTSLVGSCAFLSGFGTQPAAGPAAGDAQVLISYGALQSVAFTSTPPSGATVGGSYTISATGGGSGNPVTFSIDPSSTSGACSISGSTVSLTGAGTCQVDANQAGGNGYDTALQADQSFTIAAAPPSSGSPGGTSAPPPAPSLLVAPFASILKLSVNAHKHKADVTFSATGSVTGYQCALVRVKHGALERGKKKRHAAAPQPLFATCSSPRRYAHLKAGSYVFYVRAYGPGGTQTPPASQKFKIK